MLVIDYVRRHGFGTVGNLRVFAMADDITFPELGPYAELPAETHAQLDEALAHMHEKRAAGAWL